MAALNILPGTRYGRLTYLKDAPRGISPSGQIKRRVLCICDCGNKTIVQLSNLRRGLTKSCGCIIKYSGLNRTHGHTVNKSPTGTYISWQQMKRRCDNPSDCNYSRYGGRDIKICARWYNYQNFFDDMGERPKGTTLDRFPDNNGNYEKSNCRWSSAKAQSNNRRSNHLLTAYGLTLTLSQWEERLGLKAGGMHNRIKRGGTPEHMTRPKERNPTPFKPQNTRKKDKGGRWA